MTTAEKIKAGFQQKILPKMPVMFYRAVFREKITYYAPNEQKNRFMQRYQHSDTTTTTQPFYKPVTKPHVRF